MGIQFIFTHPCDCLARIEILVLLTALLLVVRYILDMFRRRSISTYFRVLLGILDTLPYTLLNYTIGLMQLTKNNNDVYQVWAVVLVTLQYSIRATRVSNIDSKQSPIHDMMTSLWTANLLGTRSTLLKIPLWLLWSLNSFRIILGFADTELTSSRHRRHLRLITEYMRTEHNHPPSKDCDAAHMKGYKYLVWGEDKQKVKSDPLEYKVRLEVTNRKKFITTNKVWEHNGVLLGERNKSNDLKDLCLAFALFKLLRRRFFGLPIHEANKQKTKELVLKGLIQNKNYDRAFEIIAAELAFLNDFFFTRYPVIFARGFPFLRLALSLSVIGVALYLTVIFYHSSGRLADYLSKTSNGIAVTWILLLILAVKEFCEMVFYVMSDWTKVVLISNYVQKPLWRRCTPIVCLAKLLCNCKIVKMRWHGILWQYNLLQSFRYKVPQLSGFPLYTWTPRVFYKHLPGYQGSPRNTFLKEVKEAICKSLKELCEKPEDLDKYLSRVANSHHEHLDQKIPLTSEFATETQKILVWHLATCYCEIKLAKTSQNTQTQSEYKAATALSQYSAHLLVWCSHLLPGRSLVATRLFKYTLEETRNLLVGSCKSWGDVVDELENLVKENDGGKDETKVSNDHKDAKEREQNLSKRDRRRKKGPFQQDSVLSKRDRRRKKEQDRARVITNKIIRVGVKLGGSLFALLAENGTGDDTKLWKFLEEFWARYLLHLAALVSPDDHKKLLSEGGEFLTHVWALLSHAGVLVETEQDPPSLSSSN